MPTEIRTLKDGDIEIHPRTVAKAVHTSSGSTIDVEIENAKTDTSVKLGDVNAVLENILNGSTLEEVNTKIDQINGETTGNSTTEKLDIVATTKSDLKAALAEKGQTVGDVFSTYPAAVRAIETGTSFDTVNIHVYVESTSVTIKYLSEDGMFKTAEINLYTFMDFTAIKNSAVYVKLDSTSLVASFSGNILGPSYISGMDAANVIMQGDIEIMIYPGN